MKFKFLALATIPAALFASSALAADPPYAGPAVVSLTATLVDTTGKAIGTVQLHQEASGAVQVRVDAAGLPTGAHGMHIHTTGKCEGPGFTTAGAHFNPTNKKHGLDSSEGAHGGDLAQIGSAFTGTGTHTATTDRISLTAGPLFIGDSDGSALVLHAVADDQLTDPTGNSGARIACAVLAAPTAAPLPPNTGTGPAAEDSGRYAVLAGVGAIVGAIFLATARIARRKLVTRV